MEQLKKNQMVIKLDPVAYELKEVDVRQVSLGPDTIIARVKRNLATNYRSTGEPFKNTVFYRESTTFMPLQAKAEMGKSTKLKKEDLKNVNEDIKKFTQELMQHPPQEAANMLGINYSATKTFKDKPAYITKFRMLKAVKYHDDKQSLSADKVQKEGISILMKHLDSAKIYRIKSGIFGSRDTVIGQKPKVKKVVNPNLASARNRVMSPVWESSLAHSRTLNFVASPELYEYSLAGTVPYGAEGYAYKIMFTPRKRKAKYAGILYVSPTDYAVLRAEYGLAEGKVLSGLNLKFILGIKQVENVSRGVLVFREKAEANGYYLHYSSSENGQYVYINRPLKFIEITDDDKEKVAFDLKVELNMLDREEYLNVAREKITEAAFDEVKEEEFSYEPRGVFNPKVYMLYINEMEMLKKPI